MTSNYTVLDKGSFLEELVPGPDLPDTSRAGGLFEFRKVPRGVFENGSQLSDLLCEAINPLLVSSALKVELASRDGDSDSLVTKRRLICYPTDLGEETFSEEQNTNNTPSAGSTLPWTSRLLRHSARVYIEVNTTKSSNTLLEADTLASISEIFLHQPRNHLYCVSIQRRKAVFMLCNPTGVLASHEFDYVDDPYSFFVFFYRLGRMTDEELGYHTTVRPVSDEDHALDTLKKMRRILAPPNTSRETCWKHAFESGPGFPVQRVNIQDGEKTCQYLVGRPYYVSAPMFGRGVKLFLAFDVERSVLRWCKCYWQPDIEDIVSDRKDPQCTPVQKHLRTRHTPRIRYCLIQGAAYSPLEEYRHSQALVMTLRDAFRAHEKAFKKTGVLHRGVSANNIVFDDTTLNAKGRPQIRGMLIDWDISKTVQQPQDRSSPGTRSGTWVSMSALLLNYPWKPF
ncbi:hypothetical protein EIP91_007706, partial [Steccherinum ochraceum]